MFDAKGRRTGGARMLAVVTLRPGETGRHYRLPTERDYEAVRKAQQRLAKMLEVWERGGKQGLCPVPDEPLPPIGDAGLPRAAVRHAPVGRPLHGAAEGGSGWTAETLFAAQARRNSRPLLACALNRVTMSDMSVHTMERRRGEDAAYIRPAGACRSSGTSLR